MKKIIYNSAKYTVRGIEFSNPRRENTYRDDHFEVIKNAIVRGNAYKLKEAGKNHATFAYAFPNT